MVDADFAKVGGAGGCGREPVAFGRERESDLEGRGGHGAEQTV